MPASYMEAFAEMDSDAREEFIVVELDGRVIGCLQLAIIQGPSHQGSKHAQIEAVGVDSSMRVGESATS